MRRGAAVLVLLATLPHPGVPTSPAVAQEAPVQLRLESQSSWNGPRGPLRMALSATNVSTEIFEDLTLALTIEAPARARTIYELSLQTEATSPIFTFTFEQEATLGPGETRTFSVVQPLDIVAARNETALYPLEVELRSADVPVATLRSPMIFLTEEVRVPLNLAWTWVLSSPVQIGPDGVFVSAGLESQIRPGGRLDVIVASLDALEEVPATVSVSPVLVEQLQVMTGGYTVDTPSEPPRTVLPGQGGAADAERQLAILRRVLARPSVETVAQPFGDPSIPALFESGLGADLPTLIAEGRATISSILGVDGVTHVVRPPASQLDPGTLDRLVELGAQVMLLNERFIPPEPSVFNPPGMIRLSGGVSSVAALIPDLGVAALAQAYPDDPVLAARAALGELAAIWFEFPGTPGRGATMLFPETARYSPAFLSAFAGFVSASPWLAPRSAATYAGSIDPEGAAVLASRTYPTFDDGYVQEVVRRRAELGRYETTLVDPNPGIDRLRHDLLLATARSFISRPDLAGLYLDAVGDALNGTYEGVSVPEQTFTLTSRSGTVPVVVHNDSGLQLSVRVRLISDLALEFVGASFRDVVLPPDETIVRFPVRARSTGLFTVKVQILSESGGTSRDMITESRLLLRSTAYNRVALFLTIGAALFLLAWWGRRLLPRRT